MNATNDMTKEVCKLVEFDEDNVNVLEEEYGGNALVERFRTDVLEPVSDEMNVPDEVSDLGEVGGVWESMCYNVYVATVRTEDQKVQSELSI